MFIKSLGNGMIVTKSVVKCCNCVDYEVYEPDSTIRHSTITHPYDENDKPYSTGAYGVVATRWIPDYLEKLTPWSAERQEKVEAWFDEMYRVCYALIEQEYPEVKDNPQARYSMGRITVYGGK